MNRRELMTYGAGAACAALVPEVLATTLNATSMIPIKFPPETATTLALRNQLHQNMQKFMAGGQKLTALTPDEWDTVADIHQNYWTTHAQLGNTHVLDTGIKANETYLLEKYPTKTTELNNILKYGCYSLHIYNAAEMHRATEKMRLERYGASLTGGHLVNAQYYMNCNDAWTSFSMMYGILALLLMPYGPGELIFMLSVLSLTSDAFGMYSCR